MLMMCSFRAPSHKIQNEWFHLGDQDLYLILTQMDFLYPVAWILKIVLILTVDPSPKDIPPFESDNHKGISLYVILNAQNLDLITYLSSPIII